MARKIPQPVYIRPESISIGDLIRVSWTVDDLKVSREGRVVKRDYDGQFRVFLTANGHELFRWHPSHPLEVRVTLLQSAPVEAPKLFDMAEFG